MSPCSNYMHNLALTCVCVFCFFSVVPFVQWFTMSTFPLPLQCMYWYDHHLVTPLSDLPHHDTPVIVVKWGEHYDGCTPVVKMAWSYVLSLNTNDEKLPNSNFKVSEKLPAGALSVREETIHISSLTDKVDTNMAHSLCSWTPADDVCVETKESSKGIDVTDCTVNQLHIDESQSDEPRDFLYELQQNRKNNPKNLITGSLNINSIRNKFDIIQHMLQCRYIDILALCETKLDDSFPIGQFDVLDYNCVRRDRSSNGGGLMYYIRSDIPHRRRDDLEQAVDSQLGLELIIMELMVNHKEKWLYVLGYKPQI